MHQEIIRERDETDVLILFIHGLMGCPSQFDTWIDAAYEAGYSVLSILLPGHGADGWAFAKNSLIDWETYVCTTFERYQKRYKKIVVFGHSMGGLLALNESLRPEDHIVGLFILSPPIQINTRLWSIKARLELVFTDKHQQIWAAYQKVFGISSTPFYVYPIWIRQLWSLKKLIEKTKRNLAKVRIPVYIIHSLKDETVSIKSSYTLDVGLVNADHEHLIIQNSWHAYFCENDKRLITSKLLAFIVRVTQR